MTIPQNSVLGFVYKLKTFDDNSKYTFNANILSSNQCCTLQNALILQKVLMTERPQYLMNELVHTSGRKCAEHSAKGLLQLPRVGTKLGRRAFCFFEPQTYNALPFDLKSNSYISFRKKVKSYVCFPLV